jgi:hypothetical protein
MKTFKQFLKETSVGTYAIVGCENNPNYQVWGARSDLNCNRKNKNARKQSNKLKKSDS